MGEMNWIAGQKSWSAGLQPAFRGICREKPSPTRRSEVSILALQLFCLHPDEMNLAKINGQDRFGLVRMAE
jgi:hypothetical protein